MSVQADEVQAIAREAVAANFKYRHVRGLEGAYRERARSAQRAKLREWVQVLRIVRDPTNMPFVRERLAGTGPLMGHDLRNRVILAGLDRVIAQAGRPAEAAQADGQRMQADGQRIDEDERELVAPRERFAG